ncbi:MAG: hypothetical protein ACLFQY_16775, partial [Desulfococcaceae bacterium]
LQKTEGGQYAYSILGVILLFPYVKLKTPAEAMICRRLHQAASRKPVVRQTLHFSGSGSVRKEKDYLFLELSSGN